ncbi:nucleotide exchange factor GrpE [candidate division NPL-UPA2 bacterium]|nr:nucleotide exchange factor GrpE [candidate division NPL-UPA2 bacterium]
MLERKEEIQSKLEGGVDRKKVKPKSKREGRKLSLSQEKWQETQKKAKLAEERFDRLLRLQAEFENYRKRVNRERSEFIQYALEDLICDLLPVIDNFERALASAHQHDNFHALLQGVEMVYKQVQDILVKRGLERIEALGKKFDPREHEAVMQVESEERPDNTVIEESLAGYKLKNKVIRPALVKVSQKPGERRKGKRKSEKE